jgi:hypothetical protein
MESVFVVGLSFISGCAGAFLGAYLKKKGENLATREDIHDVVTQVSAVTEVTKQIEAKISNDLWLRQTHFQIKRDALFEAMKELAMAEYRLGSLARAFALAGVPGETKKEIVDRWNETSAAFSRAKLLAVLVCGDEVQRRFDSITRTMRDVSMDSLRGAFRPEVDPWPDIQKQIADVVDAVRRELGIQDSTPQSSGSLAAQAPATRSRG